MLFLTTMAVLIGAASRESSKSLKFSIWAGHPGRCMHPVWITLHSRIA